MRQIIDGLERLTRAGGQFVLAFMVLTICYDAIMRYLFTAPTSWSLEINTFLIIYVAIMTAADVQRTDSHIRISFFADMMGRGGQRVNRVIIGIFGAVFSGIMAWRGFLMAYQAWEYGERVSSSFGTPMVGFATDSKALLNKVVKSIEGQVSSLSREAIIRFQPARSNGTYDGILLNIIDAISGRDQDEHEDLQNV